MMTQEKLEQLLFEAFLHATTQMGPRVKGMSCFLKNWRDAGVIVQPVRAKKVA